MSATVPERIDEMWERANERERQVAREEGEKEPESAGISTVVAILVEEVAALSKRLDDNNIR